MDKNHELATRFVTRWVDMHVKSRVLDGRPDKVFVSTLINDLRSFLDHLDDEREKSEAVRSSAVKSKPKKKAVANVD